MAEGPADFAVDRRMAVETPEHVLVEYPLAGPGSRYAALLLDLLGVWLGMLLGGAVLAGLRWIAHAVPAMRGPLSDGLLASAWLLWSFALLWLWFFWFEAFRDGQTPGKRRCGLRTVMEGGYPVTAEAAAVRNLLRPVDLLGFGLLGGFAMLLTRRSQRLGDLAAGTVVVREVAAELPDVSDVPAAAGPPRLDATAFAALERYVDRRAALAPAPRAALAAALVAQLPGIAPGSADAGDDEQLVRLHADERTRRLAARLGGASGGAAVLALVRSQRARWEAFRALALRARQGGLARFAEQDVGDFAARYREIGADLARARTYGASAETVYALERLVGLGHNLLYRPGRRTVRALRAWLIRGFPGLVRRRWAPVAVAAVLLAAPAAGTYALLRLRPDLEPHFLSGAMRTRADAAPARRDAGQGYVDVPSLGHAFLSSALITNNVQVAFVAFAAGITAGVGTGLVLVVNGLHLGSVLAAYRNRDALDLIGAFVLPHGVIELTAIVIAGGAGIWMGSALLLPGRRTRAVALVARARDGVALVAGVVLLLVIAGLVEGFVSPAAFPDPLKLAFAALAAATLATWMAVAGRQDDVRDAGLGRDRLDVADAPTAATAQSAPRRLIST